MLFDLDGTLTDPKEGIVGSILYALDALGIAVPEEDLGWCIGPPLAGSFARLLGTDDPHKVRRAVDLYRERFSARGLYENRVYEGIPECLAALRGGGARLLVATSKPEPFARRILDHFGLTDAFEGIYGSSFDGSLSDKGDLIAALLVAEGLDPTAVTMVGDREHDGRGAAGSGVRFLGVLYGYGSRDELLGAGAIALCESPCEIPATLARI